MRGTGQRKVVQCSQCLPDRGRYDCKECYGDGKVSFVEVKDFRSGKVDFFHPEHIPIDGW